MKTASRTDALQLLTAITGTLENDEVRHCGAGQVSNLPVRIRPWGV